MLVTNHAPYITETLRETVNERSYLENLCLKKKNSRINKKVQKNKKTSVVNCIRRSEGSILKYHKMGGPIAAQISNFSPLQTIY